MPSDKPRKPNDMTKRRQFNLKLEPGLVEQLEKTADQNDWTLTHTIRTAIRTLGHLMEAHKQFADALEDDVGELYMRLAREMPAGFVEVPKDGVRAGRAAGLPAVMIDNAWLVFPDPETGNLLAEDQSEGGIAVVRDGEIRPLKMPAEA